MPEDENKNTNAGGNLEDSKPTDLQKKLEEQVKRDEEELKGDALSAGLSKDRTHMSEHRTRMSEHRTGLSEHRTDLSEHRTELSEHRTDLSDKRTDLSFQRTALSYERTLMAWIRTATSLISFGFTMYKVFEEFVKGGHQNRLLTPRVVGIVMILFGLIGLLFAQIQHQSAYKKLKADFPDIDRSLSSVLGMLVLGFGLLLFLAVLFRM